MLFISSIFLLIMATAVYAEEQIQGVTIANNVNIREAPKIESKVLDQLSIGETVQILSHQKNWYLIKSDSRVQGWVFNDLIAVDGNENPIKQGIITADTLNVRQQADINSHIIHTFSKGTPVTITNKKNNWDEIMINASKSGWVYSDYVKILPSYPKGNILGTNVNLRNGHSLNSKIIDNLDSDAYVYVKDYSDGWYKILTYNNYQEGWIYKDYLTIAFDSGLDSPVSRSNNRIALKLLDNAKKLLGRPYVYGATGPRSFDCSGFTSYVFRQSGIKLPRTAMEQSKVGKKIARNNLQIGDLVFFDTKGRNNGFVTHVGIYIGNGKFIQSSSGKNAMKVVISDLNIGYYNKKFVIARRVF